MNRDELKGKAKDIGGRIERQAGEWTGDKEKQAEGLGKQAEGKIQQGVGKIKDAANKGMQDLKQRDRESQQQPKADEDKEHAA